LAAAVITLVILLGYERSLGAERDVEHARTMALVALIVASATVTAGLTELRTSTAVIAIVVTIGSALLLVQVGPVAALLHLRALHIDDWLVAATGGILAGASSLLLPLMRRRRRQSTRR
jgi:Ca2+-transporting ATPase